MSQTLPLTDFEEFMVRDHYPGYPNVMHVRFRFSGRLNREVYKEAVRRICERHPMTRARLNRRRGKPSGSILTQLVRRGVLRMERPPERPRRPVYRTTDRFLKLFGMENLADLPQSPELTEE